MCWWHTLQGREGPTFEPHSRLLWDATDSYGAARHSTAQHSKEYRHLLHTLCVSSQGTRAPLQCFPAILAVCDLLQETQRCARQLQLHQLHARAAWMGLQA